MTKPVRAGEHQSGGIYRAADPIGPGNDRAIRETTQGVCAWGNHDVFTNRPACPLTMLRAAGVKLFYLWMNTGEPAHPLYLPGGLMPLDWKVDHGHD